MDVNSCASSLKPVAEPLDKDVKEIHRAMIVHAIADANNRIVVADTEKDFARFRSISSLRGAV